MNFFCSGHHCVGHDSGRIRQEQTIGARSADVISLSGARIRHRRRNRRCLALPPLGGNLTNNLSIKLDHLQLKLIS